MNIRAIVVEDEPNAAKDLIYVLNLIRPEYQVAAVLPSVEKAVKWICSNRAPQLGFFDIHLEDGDSFEILRKVNVSFPVIFTTAYNQHAIDAFKVNSVDYLLKPILLNDLRRSVERFENIFQAHGPDIQFQPNAVLPSTLLIPFRDKLIPVGIHEFAFFYIEQNVVYGKTTKGMQHVLDYSMDELEKILHRGKFFRANRQVIVHRKAITELEHFFNGRLVVKIVPPHREPVIVSKARVSEFKKWIEQSLIE